MAHVLFGPEVREMLLENDVAAMREFCESLHPATVAETLADEFEVEQVWRFLNTTSIRNQATIFEYFPLEWQVKMVEGGGREHMAHLVEKMSHDDRVDLLRRLMPRVAEGLLRLVDEAERRDIATLFKQKDNTVGSIMTTDYAWLPANITASEALDRLRLQAPERETIYYVYVLNNEHDRRLLGVVSLRDLIMSARHSIIRDLMESQLVVVKAEDDKEQAAGELARYDLLALPVVDENNRLVGIVTHDDIIDVVVQEATEDVHRLGGVGPLAENYLEANFFTVWRSRAVWLSVLFVGGMLTVLSMQMFQDVLDEVIVLSLFIPICISTGGNSGAQAATLITRALALGQVTGRDWWRVLRHELMMGLALGSTLGAIGFLCGLLEPHINPRNSVHAPISPFRLALTVGSAVICICLWGTVVGSMLPLILRRVGIDPAIASNPFVATLCDVTGIIIYFLIAQALILG